MDRLLRFKSKAHHEAYMEDMPLQLSKRATVMGLFFIIYLIGGIIIYFTAPAVVIAESRLAFLIRIALCAAAVLAIWLVKWKSHLLSKRIRLIVLIIDIMAILAAFSYFPLCTNVDVQQFGGLGLLMWGWSNSSLLFSVAVLLHHWWIRVVGIFAQMLYYLIFAIIYQDNIVPFVVLAIEACVFYAATVYVVEKYDRRHFIDICKVQENLEATQKIFDNICEGIIIFDKTEHVLYANKTVSLLFGVEGKVSIERLFQQIGVRCISPKSLEVRLEGGIDSEKKALPSLYLHMEGIIGYLSSTMNVQNEDNTISVEGIINVKDRRDVMIKTKNYHIKFNPTFYMEQHVIVATVYDTTDRDALIAAQDNNNYKSRLLASVSHELRTPLNGSINFTEQAISDPAVPDEVKQKWLTPALRSNRLLLSLINDILDFSQMQENKLRLVFESRDVVSTAKECVELLEIQARKKGIDIIFQNMLPQSSSLPSEEIRSENNAFMLFTDHNRLRQIILNLLSNAVKFTFQGHVLLRLEEAPLLSTNKTQKNKILLNGERSNPRSKGEKRRRGVRFVCEDTGIGINEESQKKLFKAFEKIELGDKITLNSTGVGLGLVISNNLVQRLNSENEKEEVKEEKISIQFESKSGVGSTFYFDIYEHGDQQIHTPPIQNLPAEGSLVGVSEEDIDLPSAETHHRDVFPSIADSCRLKRATLNSICAQNPARLNEDKLISTKETQANDIQVTTDSSCSCPKVLIVDDDPFNLTALEQHLNKLDIKCDWAFNGALAIEKIRKRQSLPCPSASCSQYQVVFLDCNMPVMNGFEAARFLRKMIADGEINEMKIIACTAFVQQSELDEAKAAGVDDFCTKPVTFQMVKDVLSSKGFWEKK